MNTQQKQFIADQLANNETDSDQELIDFLTAETGLPETLITKIVTAERPKHLTNPFHTIKFNDYE